MAKQEIEKLISSWKEDSKYNDKLGYLFLNVYLPEQYVKKINDFLIRDNTFFTDLIIDMEFAYITLNQLSDYDFPSIYSLSGAKKEIKKIEAQSKYKDNDNYYAVPIPLQVEELDAISEMLKLERQIDDSITFDDLFVKFIDCYEKIDPRLLQYLQEEVCEEINEDIRKQH